MQGNDLSHFMMNCLTGEMRRKHKRELLRIYHDKLTELEAKLGIDLSGYTIDKLERDYDKVSY